MPKNELSAEERATLKQMIDTADLSAVLRGLALVCIEKCEDSQIHSQDKAAVRRWDQAHRTLMRMSEDAAIAGRALPASD